MPCLHGTDLTSVVIRPELVASFCEDDNSFGKCSVLTFIAGSMRNKLRRRNEGDTDPLLLDPGNLAFVDGRVACHHQTKARGDEGGIVNVDGGPLGRDVSHYAAHDGTT